MSSRAEAAPPRLLMVVNVFAPDRGGGAAVFSDLAYGLAERGFEVTVRCAYPYYPEWRDKSGRNGLAVERYSERGVMVERYGLFIPRNPNRLAQRLVYEASFFLSLSRALRHDRGRFDGVMVFCPLVGAVAYAALWKRLFDGPVWLNVQDLAAEAAAAGGIARGRAMGSALTGIQNRLFNAADVWSSISPQMVRRLAAVRRHDQPVLFLPNWLNASARVLIDKLPDKIGRPPTVPLKLLYAGNIGAKQDLLRFCRELAASDAPFAFRVHGSGARADELSSWVRATGDHRFAFGPFLSEEDFIQALHETDLFVVTETSGSGGSFIPSKLIPAMASATPVLAVSDRDSPLGEEVALAGIGPHLRWQDLDELPALLARVADRPEHLVAWRRQARERSQLYSRDRVLAAFDASLRRFIAGKPVSEEAGLATGTPSS